MHDLRTLELIVWQQHLHREKGHEKETARATCNCEETFEYIGRLRLFNSAAASNKFINRDTSTSPIYHASTEAWQCLPTHRLWKAAHGVCNHMKTPPSQNYADVIPQRPIKPLRI